MSATSTTHRTLLLPAKNEPLQLIDTPTPPCTTGSAHVRVLAAVLTDANVKAYTGLIPGLPFNTPIVPGISAIGRIETVGADAVSLQPGQLVYVDGFIRARDDPSTAILTALIEGMTEKSKKLMREVWNNAGTFTELATVPLENCYPLNEARLTGPAPGGLDLSVHDLMYIAKMLVPFGGLRSIDFRAGETLIVAPATGTYSATGVKLALSMGAGKVIAMGRSEEKLKKLHDDAIHLDASYGDRLSLVTITETQLDLSPRLASSSTHMTSALRALRKGGRVSLMGGIFGPVTIPHDAIMYNDLQLKGKWMYERKDIFLLIQLIENGVVKLGTKGGIQLAGKFKCFRAMKG